MAEYKLGEAEMQFAEFIWENEPITSGELVKLCEEKLSWKKSTTHTVLRRICDKGIFENSGGQVFDRYTEDVKTFFAGQSEVFVEKTFHGSLPRFLAAFTSRRKISEKEIQEILKIIEDNQIKS